MPTNSKDYVHRVGRTARAGRSGRAITVVTQYDVEMFQRIEELIKVTVVNFRTRSRGIIEPEDPSRNFHLPAAAWASGGTSNSNLLSLADCTPCGK